MKPIPTETQHMLKVLRQVAKETLERKQRLGHYAVVWQDGKPVTVGEDAPEQQRKPISD
ncbi:MAG: hypothetical protein AAFY17_16110 [Cyanobacteria bacterium J06642_11]